MKKDYFVLYTPQNMLKAYQLFDVDFSKEEIFKNLKADDDITKQVCLFKLNSVETLQEAQDLTYVLTGQHGPVREICSFKINEFLKNENYRKYFTGKKIQQIILNGIKDIIPTVARNLIEVLYLLPQKNELTDEIKKRILEIVDVQNNINFNLSHHDYIKNTFNLYWYLEALSELVDTNINDEMFKLIIKKIYNHNDYTIREKIAKILAKVDGFDTIKEYLRNDTNPYIFSKLL